VKLCQLFLTSLGCLEVLIQNCNKQTNTKKTNEHEPMPFSLNILLSCETMIRHLTLTAFAGGKFFFCLFTATCSVKDSIKESTRHRVSRRIVVGNDLTGPFGLGDVRNEVKSERFFPFCLRLFIPERPGDVLYPLGMNKKCDRDHNAPPVLNNVTVFLYICFRP